MKLANPFLISGYCSPDYFCDREAETAKMVSAIENGRDVTLISPRRMGKTGLVRHTFHSMEERGENVISLYMDIFATRDLSDFIRLLAATVLGKLDSSPQKAVSRVVKFLKSCRPKFTFDEVTGNPNVTLDLVLTEEEASLKEIFDYLQSSDKRCVLAIDEFQQIAEYPEKGTEALLRSYMQFVPNVHFVFSGSKRHLMQEMFLSANRPFFQSTQILQIGPIDPSNYFAFATKFFDSREQSFPREVFDWIYDKFEGHTWYVQCLLNRLFEYAAPVDIGMAERAMAEILDESSYGYASLLNSCSEVSAKLIKAIAAEGRVKEITAGAFISKYKLKAASSVKSALAGLLNRELVYSSDDGFIVYDRFMAEWIRRLPF